MVEAKDLQFDIACHATRGKDVAPEDRHSSFVLGED